MFYSNPPLQNNEHSLNLASFNNPIITTFDLDPHRYFLFFFICFFFLILKFCFFDFPKTFFARELIMCRATRVGKTSLIVRRTSQVTNEITQNTIGCGTARRHTLRKKKEERSRGERKKKTSAIFFKKKRGLLRGKFHKEFDKVILAVSLLVEIYSMT